MCLLLLGARHGYSHGIVVQRGKTALHLAAQCGHSRIVEHLLADSRVDVNVRDDSVRMRAGLTILCRTHSSRKLQDGNTPLMEASFFGQADVVRALLLSPHIDVGIKNRVRCDQRQ